MPQTLICRRTGKSYEVSDGEISFCEKMGVPVSDLHPDERMRELMAFRNERKLYRRTCDATGESILSAYRPDSPYTVYKNDVWWGDSWEGLDHGREFDFSRLFFEQFAELQRVVPREGTSVFNSENCEYNSHTRFSRNCYLNILISKNEDIHYCYWAVGNHDLMDCLLVINSTLCYQCMDIESCYECVNLQEAKECQDCHFSYQLQNCKHCLFSSNLANAEYRIFNKPVTKEEFETFKARVFDGRWTTFRQSLEKFSELKERAIHRDMQLLNCENSTGDHLTDCKNCLNCFDSQQGEDCLNAISLGDSKDVYSSYSSGWPRCELLYSCQTSRGSTDLAYCFYCWFSSGLRYCESMNACHDCFGSVGLRQKKWCILNKQYTKEEYETLVPKIKQHMEKTGEWGKFFPPSLSPYAYNESAAADYFPLRKEEAVRMGFAWTDYEQSSPEVKMSVAADTLPNSIDEMGDEILTKAILCAETRKPFKIIPYELNFYRRMKLPLPRLHPEIRHLQRFHERNLPKLHSRQCSQCGKETLSTLPQERSERVFCDRCYLSEVYSTGSPASGG